MTKKNKILGYFGLIIFIVGVILNIRMFLIIAWPTYLFFVVCFLGIIYISLAFGLKKISNVAQIVIIISPLLLGYVIIELTSSSDDIFLIPNGFKGKIEIIYGKKDGKPKEFEKGWRVYRIPKDGILKTQFELSGNSIKLSESKYYFIDNENKREIIDSYCSHCEVPDTLKTQVIFGELITNESGFTLQNFYIDIPNSSFKKQ